MADKAIGELPQAPSVNDNSLLAVEQQGKAMKMTGAQFKEFAKAGVSTYVESAKQAATTAQQAQKGAEAARDSILLDLDLLEQHVHNAAQSATEAAGSAAEAEKIVHDTEIRVIAAGQAQVDEATRQAQNAAQSATEASDSATLSESWAVGGTGVRPGEDTNNSKYWADKAQAEADRATVPALEGVYNIILIDRITLQKYALLVEERRLKILGVSDDFSETEMRLIDVQTGLSYNVVVDNGEIGIEEV